MVKVVKEGRIEVLKVEGRENGLGKVGGGWWGR
jgi:hypothetical protein